MSVDFAANPSASFSSAGCARITVARPPASMNNSDVQRQWHAELSCCWHGWCPGVHQIRTELSGTVSNTAHLGALLL